MLIKRSDMHKACAKVVHRIAEDDTEFTVNLTVVNARIIREIMGNKSEIDISEREFRNRCCMFTTEIGQENFEIGMYLTLMCANISAELFHREER